MALVPPALSSCVFLMLCMAEQTFRLPQGPFPGDDGTHIKTVLGACTYLEPQEGKVSEAGEHTSFIYFFEEGTIGQCVR